MFPSTRARRSRQSDNIEAWRRRRRRRRRYKLTMTVCIQLVRPKQSWDFLSRLLQHFFVLPGTTAYVVLR